jgi:prepilin-type N-terminal cleavage/methylation domain-containing protein
MNDSINSRGFSLIEMLIAIVILSISLLALAGLMVTTTQNNSFGGHMTEAATFAQGKLEELKVTSWGNIVTATDPNPPEGSTKITYTRTWNVSILPNPSPIPAGGPWPNNENQLLKTITITVTWNDGVNRSINIISAIRNPAVPII